MDFMEGWKRDIYCAESSKEYIGRELTLMGWVQRRRDLGELIFIWLRDKTGIMQIVFEKSEDEELFARAEQLRPEYVIAVRGTVAARDENNINPALKTGEVELRVKELKIFSESETPPFPIEDNINASELTRLKYRFLDLRRPVMQRNIAMRARVMKIIRSYLDENGFTEIETPILMRSTPEGARDYLVPSRVHKGQFYALPQSPQLLKQLLMISGFDRYYQLARCFRDEDLRADRQPEFTQIDLEMSFVDMDDILSMAEGMLARVFSESIGVKIDLPMRRMTYAEALSKYGSDKPDIRFELFLHDITPITRKSGFSVFDNAGGVQAICLEGGAALLSRKELDKLTQHVRQYNAKGLAWAALGEDGVRSSFAKFLREGLMDEIASECGAKTGDLILIIADADPYIAQNAMGLLRTELGRRFNLYDPTTYAPLWVVEFPFFEFDRETGEYVPMHHPFTCPMEEDMQYLSTDKSRVRAKAFDIVINGYELASGSVRIHSADLQKRMFRELGIDDKQAEAKFGFLLEGFKYGAPPHAGIAPGLDRLMMLLLQADNIKDVSAFPKMQNASDAMMDAPNYVDEESLKILGISIDKQAETETEKDE